MEFYFERLHLLKLNFEFHLIAVSIHYLLGICYFLFHRFRENRGLKRSISTSSSSVGDNEQEKEEDENMPGDDTAADADPPSRDAGAAPSTPKRAKRLDVIVSPKSIHLATNGDPRKKWLCWICSRSKYNCLKEF